MKTQNKIGLKDLRDKKTSINVKICLADRRFADYPDPTFAVEYLEVLSNFEDQLRIFNKKYDPPECPECGRPK